MLTISILINIKIITIIIIIIYYIIILIVTDKNIDDEMCEAGWENAFETQKNPTLLSAAYLVNIS